MGKKEFLTILQSEVANSNLAVPTQNGDWIINGFIDIARNIYTISCRHRSYFENHGDSTVSRVGTLCPEIQINYENPNHRP